MNRAIAISVVIGLIQTARSQIVDWCKDENCSDCPSAVTTGESRYPECVIYDTNVVFGGQGFKEGAGGDLLYEVYGNFLGAPCGDQNGAIFIRSPASLTSNGCGNLIVSQTDTGCLRSGIQLQETFMVQYCCGVTECASLGAPVDSRRAMSIGGHASRANAIAAASGGGRGLYLTFKNGTVIPPKEVGLPPNAKRLASVQQRQECNGYQQGSYKPNGDIYFTTFDTQILTATLGPFAEPYSYELEYSQTVEVRTGFSLSVGDPLGIISASVNVEFATSRTEGVKATIQFAPGVTGRIGFTPVYICTKGTLTNCDGSTTPEAESCTAYKLNGEVQGDYSIVQS